MTSPRLRTRIIAVIDDDHRLRESLEDLLEAAGYGVRLFCSAEEFLDSRIADVDCVLSDIGMPGADGFELQYLVGRLRPTLPVLLISGRHEYATAEFEAARGGRRIFGKPFDRRELLSAIAAELQAPDDAP